MATNVVPVNVGDDKKEVVGETNAEITQEEKDDQLNGDDEVDDGVDEGQGVENEEDVVGDENEEDVVGDENEEDVVGDENEEDWVGDENEEDWVGDENEEDVVDDENEEDLVGDENEEDVVGDENEEDLVGDENEEDMAGGENEEDVVGDENEEALVGDDQQSINKDSTENPNIATDSAGGDAPSDAKGSVKEPMDSATDANKDAKQQMDASQNTVLDAYKDMNQQVGAVCRLFAPSNNNNTPAAANQQQQPQPQRRRPQQKPQGRRQTQQMVSVPTPQEQQPTESDSTPQPPTQPRQRQKPQGRRPTQQVVSVPTPQEQQPTESDSTPQPQQQPTESDSTPQPPTQPRQRQKPQGRRPTQQKVSVPTPQEQLPTESDSTPQPQQQPTECDSAPQPPTQPRQRQKPQGRRPTQQKVSVPTPQEQQPMESDSTPQPQQQPTESDSTPQPPTQPRQRQKPQKQRQPQKKVSVTPQAQQPQQQPQQKVSVSPPQALAQQPQQKLSVSPPQALAQQPQQQPQQRVSVSQAQAQQPQQQPQQKLSVSPPQALAQQPQQQPQQKVSVSPPQALAQQPRQQPQQKASVSPPQALAQQQVNKVSDAPPNTEPQPQQQLETQANPSVQEKGTIARGVANIPTPEEDATTLYTAFKGRGCDVGRLVHVLTKRDGTHRHLIQQHYKKNYGEDLIDRISSELSRLGDLKEKVGLDLTVNPTGTLSRTFSSNIKRAVSLWMFEESERDATIVWQALQVTSFDKAAVTEVICSRTPSQLRNLQRAYCAKFSSQLLQDINSSNFRFNGPHQELLIACLDDQARDEGTNVDLKLAEEDAKRLFEDGEKIWGTNNRTFIDIFTKRNRPHLVAVDDAYHKLYGHSLEKAVEKETSRSFKDGLLTLLSCAKNPAKYFAEVLYNAMKGVGTSDTTLIRTVVTRAGIDMEDVKKEYAQTYKKSLKDAIHRDTSGDYRTFLISLVE